MDYESLTIIGKMSMSFARVVTRQLGCESAADQPKYLFAIKIHLFAY